MIGTLINAVAIVMGGLIGVVLKKGIPERIRASLLKTEGVAIILIGLSSTLCEMLSVNPETGKLTVNGGLLLLVSLVVGCLLGEAFRIDDYINTAGRSVENRFRSDGLAKGLVTASIVFCLGAMSIIGPINEGLTGDRSILLIKALLDFITAIMLASVMGVGVAFSALTVLVFQAIPSLLATQLAPFITPDLLSPFCMVGYTLVTLIGLNFLLDTDIRIANLLPALAVPVAYHFTFA